MGEFGNLPELQIKDGVTDTFHQMKQDIHDENKKHSKI
jgi:hypothetical protein